MPYKDPARQRDAQRRHYLKTKIARLAKQKDNRVAYTRYNREHRQVKRDRVIEIKTINSCMDCSNFYPAPVMEFDHVRGDKIGNISMMVSANASWEALENEIAKCDLVCANCHRLREMLRNGWLA